MKVIFGLAAVLIVIGAAIYFFGGFSDLDPEQQAADFTAAVQPGMDWKQVVELQEPKKYFMYRTEGQSQPEPYTEQVIADGIANGTFANGFCFPYTFTGELQYEVIFDPSGKVTGKPQKVTTLKDINPMLQ